MKARKFSYFHIAILIFILICLVSPIKINSYGHTRLRLDFYRAYAEDPTDINLSANTVAENLSVGTPVGILTTTDADPGDTFIYSFATGTGDTDNASFSINGDTLETAETFDFESKITYDIRIRSTDSTAGFTEKQFTITITNANDAPVCLPIELATNEDASGMALPDCTDAEDDSLTYAVASQPANGSAAVVNDNGNDKLEYTPVLNHNGTDPFTYQANDGELDSAPANVNVTVNPMNDAPVAQTQSVSTNEDEDKVIILVATDIDGDDLDYFIVLQPEPGSLNGTPPTVTYHPPLNYSGPDSFTFKANDGTIDSNIAEVSIDITPENDAPTNINLSGDHKVEEKIEPGVVVGTFSTVDIDSGPNFDYSPFSASGCNSSGNSSFEIAGDSLKTKVVFDYEVQTFYWICVQTNDGNGGTFHKSFKIDILDKPKASITVTPIDSLTSETGDKASFKVVLDFRPSANVGISLSSSDTSEGVVLPPTTLTFTSSNWNTPKTVIVEGKNDSIADGAIVYTIVTAPAVSNDPDYTGVNPDDVSMTNADDDKAGLSVAPLTGLVTTEGKTSRKIQVKLNTQPTAGVSISFSSSDISEGIVSPSQLTITKSTWTNTFEVQVTGVDDFRVDGDKNYSIKVLTSSTDPNYNALQKKVLAINRDAPNIKWTSPVNTEQIFVIRDLVPFLLTVKPSSPEEIARVRFYRWDHINLRTVDIAEIAATPYQYWFDPGLTENRLGDDFNQFFARAIDSQGDFIDVRILIDKQGNQRKVFLPISRRAP